MDAIVTILYWIQLILFVLAVVVAVVVAVRGSGSRAFVPWRAVTQAVLAVAVFAVAFVLAGAGSSVLWTVVLVVLGAALGYLLAGGERVVAGEGAPGLRRSAVAPGCGRSPSSWSRSPCCSAPPSSTASPSS